MIEMIVVVIIMGILVSIALPRYVKVVEKGRSAEARTVLGNIRAAETAYYLEYDSYTTSLAALSVGVPTSCNASYYFNYTISGGGAAFTAQARRCTSGGRSPNAGTSFMINLTQSGDLTGTAGYL